MLSTVALGAGSCEIDVRRADLNLDGHVDVFDATLVATCIGAPTDPRCASADVNADGGIDLTDLAAVNAHFGVILFDPVPAPYTPASIHLGRDGVLYFHAPTQNLVHRWSLPTRRALAPIQISSTSSAIAVSSELNRLYVAYATGEIRRVELGGPSLAELTYTTPPGVPRRIFTAGRFLITVDDGSFNASFRAWAPDGTLADAEVSFWTSDEYTWSDASQRIYHFRDGNSPNDVHYQAFDSSLGTFLEQGESPYHGGFDVRHPIRVSPDGTRVLIGSGDVYDGESLEIAGAIPLTFLDAAALEGGDALTLVQTTDQRTLLQHWSGSGTPRNVARFDGRPLRVFAWEAGYAVVTQRDGRPAVQRYVADADGDADGVPHADDAFPLDAAAARDSDGDGFPDGWNPGRDADDSTSGLVLDAFPLDSACQLASHALPGAPDVCDVARFVPAYTPTRVEIDPGGTIYLLSPQNDRVFRWSLLENAHLNPLVVGDAPTQIAYAPEQDRLHVGYPSGSITSIDLGASPRERAFAVTPANVNGLQSLGPFLFATDPSDFYQTHYTFAADGDLAFARSSYPPGRGFVWSAANARMYYTMDGISPNDVHWEEIDPVTGALGALGESPYHGDYLFGQLVRVSVDGQHVLVSSGDLFEGLSLEHEGVAVPGGTLTDALWLGDGRLIVIRASGTQTRVEQWGADLQLYGSATFPGSPLRVLGWNGGIAVVTLVSGRPTFGHFVPDPDGDDDGVLNEADAFPLDPAASLDGDGDGAPDEWNPGRGPGDSTQGLVLDAFPDDVACQRVEHGVGGVCDFALVLPPEPSQPICALDRVSPAAASGMITVRLSGDLAALCDGWLLIGDVVDDQVAVHNSLDGRRGPTYPLGSRPGDLELDADAKRLYVALPDALALAVVDLSTGGVQTLELGFAAASLELGAGGLLIGTTADHVTTLRWLAPGATEPSQGWPVRGDFVLWNAAAGELVTMDTGLEQCSLNRFSFDPGSGATPIESLADAGFNTRGLDVSPDGVQIALIGAEPGGVNPGVRTFAAQDLAQPFFAFSAPFFAWKTAFDPFSSRLLVAASTDLIAYDPANGTPLASRTASRTGCSGDFDTVAWSRGGRFALGRQGCGFRGKETRFHWLRVD